MIGQSATSDTIGAPSGIELADVSVLFGDAAAVSHVSLSVPVGKTLAVLGPSGSGKSTLLRAVAGLEPLATGAISIGGLDQLDVPIDQRQLGLMFQDHALFPHLDVAGNVGFGLKMRGVERSSTEARVTEVLELVGLAGFASRDVQTLSGGEAQRVALARSLAPSPRVLLLDEPLASLDRVLREGLVDELRRLFSALAITVVHVTHDQQEAFALADHVVIMREGQVVQQGAPAELWRRPADTFIAEFLGHPNIWRGADGDVLAPVPSLTLSDMAPEASDDSITIVRCLVVDRAFREGRWRLTLDEQSGAQRRIVVDADTPHQVGEQVSVRIDHNELHPLGAPSTL